MDEVGCVVAVVVVVVVAGAVVTVDDDVEVVGVVVEVTPETLSHFVKRDLRSLNNCRSHDSLERH